MQVQEQPNKELFLKSYQTDESTWHNVTLKEILTTVHKDLDLDSLKFGHHKPFFCVSVPGQSEWVQADTVQSMIQPAAGNTFLPVVDAHVNHHFLQVPSAQSCTCRLWTVAQQASP